MEANGGRVRSWNRIEDQELSDPSDIRLIGHPDAPVDDKSLWLVLDRGHHQLSAMDLCGTLLFRIGKPLSPNLFTTYVADVVLECCQGILSPNREPLPE